MLSQATFNFTAEETAALDELRKEWAKSRAVEAAWQEIEDELDEDSVKKRDLILNIGPAEEKQVEEEEEEEQDAMEEEKKAEEVVDVPAEDGRRKIHEMPAEVAYSDEEVSEDSEEVKPRPSAEVLPPPPPPPPTPAEQVKPTPQPKPRQRKQAKRLRPRGSGRKEPSATVMEQKEEALAPTMEAQLNRLRSLRQQCVATPFPHRSLRCLTHRGVCLSLGHLQVSANRKGV